MLICNAYIELVMLFLNVKRTVPEIKPVTVYTLYMHVLLPSSEKVFEVFNVHNFCESLKTNCKMSLLTTTLQSLNSNIFDQFKQV